MEKYVERLRQVDDRKIDLPEREMADQVAVVQYLVMAAKNKLRKDKILKQSGSPTEKEIWEGFFVNRSIAIKLTSVGPTDVSIGPLGGLLIEFIDMDDKSPSSRIVSFMTVKRQSDVGKEQALWLSHYAPENIRLMGSLILGSEPVSVEEFDQKTQAAFS